ncbi:11893_t:CDS:2 [Funneliformis geosporum]|uniref:11893_t:CDS:1 n=1 Tax=Funneliformis geosporum TaxID=1117311 RepID=A0A9W4SRM4_9GLOM|nr:11893_t:CDS:2 [Funneliformis geosporum]
MSKVKKRVLYLRKIAKISKQRKFFENKDNNEEYNSSDNEDLDMGFEWKDGYFDKKESLFQTLVDNMKIFIPSKRPLTYHGNSVRTKRRKKKFIHEAIKANEKIDDEKKNNNKRDEINDSKREEGNYDEGKERNDDEEARNDNEGKEENDDERISKSNANI